MFNGEKLVSINASSSPLRAVRPTKVDDQPSRRERSGSPALDAPRNSRRGLVARELARYVLLSSFSVVLVALLLGRLSRQTGTEEAIRDAKHSVRVIASNSIEPALTVRTLTDLTSDDSRARAAALDDFDRLALQARESAGLVRIKLWNSDGKLIYSDDHRLLVEGAQLGADELNALKTGEIEAEVSELSKAENRFEQADTKLLEVYLPITSASDDRLLFEAYLPYSSVTESGRSILREFAPSMIIGLIALQIMGVLLVWSVARRLRRATEGRELLLQHAIESSDAERRRIAADLHDGVVQDLTGISLSLAASRMRSTGKGQPIQASEADAAFEQQIRDAINSLRSLIVDIYPPNLQSEGLEEAIRSLCAKVHNRGITTRLLCDLDEQLIDPPTVSLCYRTIQETLRNVSTHANASHVDISLESRNANVVVRVEDDGLGFDPQEMLARVSDGHFGLRGLGDLVSEQHGSLRVFTGPGRGTQVELTLPLS